MRVPKLCRHSSGWYYVRVQGKFSYLSRNKAEAQDKYRNILAQQFGVLPEPIAQGGITVAELLDQYAAGQFADCQARWVRNRRGILRLSQADARRLYGYLPAAAFGPKCLQAVRKAIATQGRCRQYVNALCTKLKGAWKWGVGHEIVPLASYQALHLVPDLKPGELGLPEGEDREPVDPALVAQVMPYLSEKNADLLRLLQLTAARPDELVRLKASDIQRHPDGTWTFTPRQHKTSKANRKRLLVFNPEARTILAKYVMKAKGPGYLFPVAPCQRITEGTEPHYRVSSLCHAVHGACERAKLETFTPYQIRHAKLTSVSFEHGVDVAAALGGNSVAVLKAHYDHNTLARAKKAVS